MGVDEGNLQVKDLDVILEKLSNKYSSSLWYILTSTVAIMVIIFHTISYI